MRLAVFFHQCTTGRQRGHAFLPGMTYNDYKELMVAYKTSRRWKANKKRSYSLAPASLFHLVHKGLLLPKWYIGDCSRCAAFARPGLLLCAGASLTVFRGGDILDPGNKGYCSQRGGRPLKKRFFSLLLCTVLICDKALPTLLPGTKPWTPGRNRAEPAMPALFFMSYCADSVV